jgi:hypothetical protein
VERFIALQLNNLYDCQYYEVESSNPLDYLFVYDEVLDFKDLTNKADIISTTIEAINNDEYLNMRLDYYYLEGMEGYAVNHSIHGQLVIGYNLTLQEIYYLANLNEKWVVHSTSFIQYEQSFKSALLIIREDKDTDTTFDIAFRLNEPFSTFRVWNKDFNRKVRLNVIYNSLTNILNGGVFTTSEPTDTRRFGISIYKGYYEDLFNMLLNNSLEPAPSPFVVFRGLKKLYENKKGIMYRFSYLNKHHDLQIEPFVFSKMETILSIINEAIVLLSDFFTNQQKDSLLTAAQKFRDIEKLDIEVLQITSLLIYNKMKFSI